MNLSREPVIKAAAVVAVIEAGLIMAVALGWLDLTNEQLGAIMAFVVAFVAVVAPLIGAWWARSQVTPVSDPRNNEGKRLT